MKLINSFFWKFNMVLLGTCWNYVWIRWSSSEMVIRVLKWRQFSITGFFSEWNKGSSGPNSGKFKGNFFPLHVQVLNFFLLKAKYLFTKFRDFSCFCRLLICRVKKRFQSTAYKNLVAVLLFFDMFFLWRKREIRQTATVLSDYRGRIFRNKQLQISWILHGRNNELPNLGHTKTSLHWKNFPVSFSAKGS